MQKLNLKNEDIYSKSSNLKKLVNCFILRQEMSRLEQNLLKNEAKNEKWNKARDGLITLPFNQSK